ncbi:MAG: nicotinate (nicotinamide) nucleotide adenylyltransferase [Chlorobiaceae bacterium]|nr:nicotinate (nicotinamide) nucleotide adenylyltransferase [Chlorobiaceae bacterium]NTV59969.1 nicotinate (nicotinamide) nucleotide adenylyltransferase [Chlorobiaceae bacterium]
MHIGVYGGSFDPPHNGHLALCLIARELLKLDRIIISVSNNPLKPGRDGQDSHRKHMAELLAAEINLTGNSSEVCSWELEKRKPSYTVDFLLYIRTIYPGAGITLLLGEDSYSELHLWKDPARLITLCDIAVFRRAISDKTDRSAENPVPEGTVRFIDFSMTVSSSEIRALVARKEPIDSMVPASIMRYIGNTGLYGQ